MAEALYRKYRPQIFEDVVGQEHIERTLKNALRSDKVSHAYMFTGPRGTGKTTTARLLAKALLCEKGPTPDPDGTCEDCELIAVGEHPDVYELDAASRTGVENVREEIIGRVNYAPTRGRYKVYIIDEVHMLSNAAFNALLKTLEEPPEHVVFVLCTTDPQQVPETIQSRCQRFDFRRIASEELIIRLAAICTQEDIEYDADALDLIAHRAQGGMRDAITSLEQLIAFGDGKVTLEQAERLLGSMDSSDTARIVKAIGVRDAAECFKWTSEYMETGADIAQFAQDLAEHIRNMYVMSVAGLDVALDVTDAGRRELESELSMFGADRLSRMLDVLGDLIADLRASSNQRLSFEIALTRLIRPDSDITLASLAERIEALEKGGIVTPSAQVVPNAQGVQSVEVTQDTQVRQDAQPIQNTQPMQSMQTVQNTQAVGDRSFVRAESTPKGKQDVQPDARSDAQPDIANTAAVRSGMQSEEEKTVSAHVINAVSDFDRVWSQTMAHLKKESASHAALFMNARPMYDAKANLVTVGFDLNHEYTFVAAQKPEVRQSLENAFVKAGLSGIQIEIKKIDPNSVEAALEPTTRVSVVQAAENDVSTSMSTTAIDDRETTSMNASVSDYADFAVSDDVKEEFGEFDADNISVSDETSQNTDSTHLVPEDLETEGSNEMDADALNDMLASTFGEGISFEEVD